MKRFFDVVFSSAGLIVAAPMMLVIAAIVKLESRGPVFYSCKRVGKFGKPFGMLKFRTMVENADNVDCKLCPSGDVRVTEFGSFLRRTKLNELPQLINVLAGDMSLVGPRPEDPKLMKVYKDKWDVVLSIRPGIVGPNQIVHRNEDDLFPPGEDPERFYIDHVLREKLERDMEYVRGSNPWKDFSLLARGVYATLFKGFGERKVSNRKQLLQWVLFDVALSGMAYVFANLVWFDILEWNALLSKNLFFVLTINGFLFLTMGLYRRSVRFFSLPDLLFVTKLGFIAAGFLVLFNYFALLGTGHSRAVFIAYAVLLIGLVSSARIMTRLIMEKKEQKVGGKAEPRRILIYGAGRLGLGALRRLRFEPACKVVGFVDDDPSKANHTVAGVKVLGTGLDLAALKTLYGIDKIVVAFKSPDEKAVRKIHRRALKAGIDDVLLKTSIFELRGDDLISNDHVRHVEFTDTIGLKPVSLPPNGVLRDLDGSSVAVVGAGDQLGAQLCNELVPLGVRQIIVLEDCEARLDMIVDSARSLGSRGISIVPYFVPLAAPGFVEKQLASYDIKWMIYNGFNRSFGEAFLNQPAQDVLRLVDAIGYIEMAGLLGLECFSLLSPYIKDHLPAQKKEFVGLLERYLNFVARRSPDGTRYGAIRLANVIEVENEIFRKTCHKTAKGLRVMVPAEEMHFTTARNAARVVLNSYPLHGRGEVFVDGSSLPYHLKSLVKEFFEFNGNGANGNSVNEFVHLDGSHAAGENGDGFQDCIESGADSVLMLRNGDFFDQQLISEFEAICKSCLPVLEKEARERMESFLKEFQSGPDLKRVSTVGP